MRCLATAGVASQAERYRLSLLMPQNGQQQEYATLQARGCNLFAETLPCFLHLWMMVSVKLCSPLHANRLLIAGKHAPTRSDARAAYAGCKVAIARGERISGKW